MLLSKLHEFVFAIGRSFWLFPEYFSMCGVLREASDTMRSNEQRRFVDVTDFSGLFNCLYTSADIPLAVQQLP